MGQGWVKTHREITTKPIYQQSPLYLRIFERLIIEANCKCARIPYGKEMKLIKRGEKLTSIGQIAEWVGWYERGIFKTPNKKTVSDILDWLIKNELIEIYNKGNARETHYNVLNYCIYQAKESDESNAKVTPDKRPLDTNKNIKNIKNIKNKDIAVFDYWNSKSIIVHKNLTDKVKRKILVMLENYTEEEIKKAIDNYNTILTGDKYYWTHKWTLEEFLQKGFDKFFDDSCLTNYMDKQKDNKPKEDKPKDQYRRG